MVKGEADKARILEVRGIDDAREAVQAARMGKAKLVDVRSKRLSEVERKRESDRALGRRSKSDSQIFTQILATDLSRRQNNRGIVTKY
jgi:hypothetical protein